MRYLPAILLVCAASPAAAEPATRSDRATIVAWATQTLADPYALRSTQISDRMVIDGVRVVCISFNPKNQVGGYAGVMRHPFELQGETLVPASRRTRVNSDTCYTSQISWRPFPELAAIK